MNWKGTILVAERDTAMMTLMCDVLNKEGFSVARYDTVNAAMDGIRTNIDDVVVLDADYGCRSPFEVLRDIHALADHPQSPTIIVWTRSSIGSLWCELEQMCERILPDVIDPGEVAFAVRALAGRSAASAVG